MSEKFITEISERFQLKNAVVYYKLLILNRLNDAYFLPNALKQKIKPIRWF